MARGATAQISPLDRRPLPRQVAEAVEELIATSGLRPGDHLPTEAELAGRLGVGRSTVREALGELARAGVVDRRWGVGTLVAAIPPPRMGLEVLESLEALAARQGWECGTTDLHVRRARASVRQARRLGVTPGAPVTVITRLKTRAGRPVVAMTSVVAEEILTHDTIAERFEHSITDLVRALPRSPLRHARAEVTATRAGPTVARQLRVRAGSPLLVLDEEFLDAEGAVLVWNVLEFVPGAIRVELVRRITP